MSPQGHSRRRLGRPGSLRGRLTVGMIAILLIAGLLVGVVSELSLRHFLIARLDQQLAAAGDRYAATLQPEGEHRPLGDPDDVIPGQSAGTLGIRRMGVRIVQAVVVGTDGTTDPITLDQASTATLTDLDPGADPSSVDLPGIGDFRIRAVRGTDGDIQVTGLPLHPVDETLLQLLVVEAALFAALVALGGTAAGLFVRRTLRPLEQLSHTALTVSTLALTGTEEALPTTAATPSATEVDRVSQALDRMLDRMRQAMASRDATEAQLRRFIADASHELRTPLASIRANAEYGAATEPGALPEQTIAALGGILSAADRMGMLVADLLLLARLDAGRPLQSATVDLTRLVLDTVAESRIAGLDHRWELDLPEEIVTVDGDEERLRQVIANLLSNARMHTPAGTTVTTGIAVEPDHAVVWVADDGPGVPLELRPILFDRFARGDSSRSGAHGSTGLGLAIAHGIARAHHGDLTFETARGGGAQFRLLLPLGGDQRKACDAVPPVSLRI